MQPINIFIVNSRATKKARSRTGTKTTVRKQDMHDFFWNKRNQKLLFKWEQMLSHWPFTLRHVIKTSWSMAICKYSRSQSSSKSCQKLLNSHPWIMSIDKSPPLPYLFMPPMGVQVGNSSAEVFSVGLGTPHSLVPASSTTIGTEEVLPLELFSIWTSSLLVPASSTTTGAEEVPTLGILVFLTSD